MLSYCKKCRTRTNTVYKKDKRLPNIKIGECKQCNQLKTLKAGNIFHDAYNRISDIVTNKKGSKDLRNLIESNGDSLITHLVVCRQPIESYISVILNSLSLGSLDSILKDFNYDNLFHLWLGVILSNGKQFIIEKNQRINVSDYKLSGERKAVKLKKFIPLKDFINNTINYMGEDNFYSYSAADNNCQIFVASLLEANGLSTTDLKNFIMQDTKSIFEQMPSYIRYISDKTTDMAAKIDQIIYGNGLYF